MDKRLEVGRGGADPFVDTVSIVVVDGGVVVRGCVDDGGVKVRVTEGGSPGEADGEQAFPVFESTGSSFP